jgi:nitrogen regulatory protein PII
MRVFPNCFINSFVRRTGLEKEYIFMLVLNDISRFKPVKKKLIELDYKRFTVIDTIGATGKLMEMGIPNTFSRTMSEMDNTKYNKTLFLVVKSEDEVLKIMDELEKVINIDKTKPGKGIMFTVPVIKSQGIRY